MSQPNKTMNKMNKSMSDREGKYLTFNLTGEQYGIGIIRIREIIGMMPI
ncbi:MAG: chemotaxis protein CheW, partial [Deltaproteobacteria bacterium]|nr:chemotaxis protein CheW [Deltaproteobacteria bacterium]